MNVVMYLSLKLILEQKFGIKSIQTIQYLLYNVFFYFSVKVQEDWSIFGEMRPKKVIEILLFDCTWLN